MQTLPPHLIAVIARFHAPTSNLGCRVSLSVPYFYKFTRKKIVLCAEGQRTLELACNYLQTKGINVLSFSSFEDYYTLHVNFDQSQELKNLLTNTK
jgi:hypothetical protein